MKRNRKFTALDAVTATTTSDPIDVSGAKKVSFIFKRANHSSGSTAFTVTGSLDGTNYVALAKLVSNAANTNSQTILRVASVTLSSDTSALYSLDLQHDCFQFVKVTATETTDGTHSCYGLIEL